MATIERDVVTQGLDSNGNNTIDYPLARLGWIEDTADIKETPTAEDYVPLVDMADNGQMKKTPASALGMGGGAAPYSETTAYAVGDYCSYVCKLYRCIAAIPAGGEVWDPSHWEETSLTQELQAAQAAAKAAQDAAEDANQKLQEAEAGGGIGGGSGNELKITFEAAFKGQPFTVSDGEDTKTGTVPEGLTASVRLTNCNSTYTVTATADNGVEYATSVATGAYYGQYTATLAVFNATINVTAAAGAAVTAAIGGSSFTATAGTDGVAAVRVNQTGAYTVSAVKDGASSNTASVEVTAEGDYTAAVSFIVLTVTSEAGASLTLTNGEATFTGSGTGTDVFYLPGMGTWTATLTGTEETSTKSINVTEYKAYTLKVMFVSEVLAENDWEKIRDVADAGEAANYWAVGDTKPVTLNGTIGTLSVSNLTLDAFIIGFDHNAAKEGANRIDFLLGKLNGKMVGLCDGHYNTNSQDGSKWFNMNHWGNVNYGGWAACDLRYDILGSTNKAPSGYGSQRQTNAVGYDAPEDSTTNPVANTVMAALPPELRQNMRLVTKYADAVGNDSNVAGNVKATKDYLFLLSEYEIQGNRSYANQYEKDSQAQYDYFKAGNSKIAYNHASSSSAVWFWSRSAHYHNTNNFCTTAADGSPYNHSACTAGAVLPGFSI